MRSIVRSNFGLCCIIIAIGLAVCLIAGANSGDNRLHPRIVQQDEFSVVGIAARTNNAREAGSEGVIGKQWARLMQEDVLAKIPNKLDHSIVAVYTDYAGDHNGDYTYILGARVSSVAEVPAGMVAAKIPAGRYAVFTSAKGPGYKVVPELWMKINALGKSEPGGDRVYRSDFEVYDERASDPQNLVADIYIGIR